MNQKQRVFNMLAKTSKTQLGKTRNVKFSLADDLTKAYEEAESAASNISMQVEAAYEMVAEVIGQIPAPDSFLEDVDAASARLEVVINEARSGAEQLGIDPRDIPGFSEAEAAMTDLESVIQIVARYEADIVPILRVGGF
ncbi:MAG: hypothetical protein EHM12_08640 [Dehalococcoidia bacterium]|jgi:hypothetical protein|nr:MAG: hypothetical protein EHM12_08640 [Dehalococcoidia bacterium]